MTTNETSPLAPVIFPISEPMLIRIFGEPDSLNDIYEMAWHRQNVPLITSKAGLNLIKPLLDRIGSEFCCALSFKPAFISTLCYQGFFPMATRIGARTVLLIKVHQERCLLLLKDLHISRQVKKRSRHFEVTVDQAFDMCIDYINKQHENSWLYSPLVAAFKKIIQVGGERVHFHSIEVWQGSELVAGEIGYAVGSCYSSLSGFYRVDSAGSVQLCAAAGLLRQNGFTIWDLGMEMEYKRRLGAQILQRDKFLALYRRTRTRKRRLTSPRINARELIMGTAS